MSTAKETWGDAFKVMACLAVLALIVDLIATFMLGGHASKTFTKAESPSSGTAPTSAGDAPK